jgi:inner membrane protein
VLALEIAIPGVFLLWFGIAAVVTGTLTLIFGHTAFWPWEVQIIAFLAMSIFFAYKGKSWMDSGNKSDQPLLNQRDAQLVGRTTTLVEPIREGYGRIRIDDTQWRVKGPDLPAGVRVKVASFEAGELTVEAI